MAKHPISHLYKIQDWKGISKCIENNVCTGVAKYLCADERITFWIYIPICEAMKEISTKLLIEWVDREFIAVHTLFILKRHSVPKNGDKKTILTHRLHVSLALFTGPRTIATQRIATQTISTRQSPPIHYPPGQFLPDNPHPDNLYQTIPTWTLPTQTISTRQSPPGHYPPR